MKRSIINITMDSNYTEVLFEDKTKEKTKLTQPKFELYSSAKIQLEKIQKSIKKNRKIGWTFNGIMWLLYAFLIFNSKSSHTLLSAAVHANISYFIMLSIIAAVPFHMKSLSAISKRERLTSNIDSINEKLDKAKEYNVSNNYFMQKDLSVKENSPEYTDLIFDLNKELLNNPVKYNKSWECQYEDDVQSDFGNFKHMKEKSCAEEVEFEMVTELSKEKKLVKVFKI